MKCKLEMSDEKIVYEFEGNSKEYEAFRQGISYTTKQKSK